MPEDDVGRAFERFYRGDGTRGLPGSGLGLPIVKRAIERFGGTVQLTSGPDGTTVAMDLPAVPEQTPSREPKTTV
jgi:two-component system sensor histidine kinase MprB